VSPTTIETLLAAGPPADDADAAMAAFTERADREGLVDVAWATSDSPIGPLALATTDQGLLCVWFGDAEPMIEQVAAKVSPRVLRAPHRVDAARRQLDEYFDGTRTEFDMPLDWRLSVSGFRRRVLQRLFHDVGYGHVVSYRDLAVAEGSPGASRAVGTTMATNPIPIVVPCHRVLRTGGALGGYGGGLDAKRWLLRLEGVSLC
jgi:methylated-DNA-[protein]-cysteine S-methyltransferase